MKQREPILVAMSGGVDSSVAAALLVEAGHPIVGVFMRGSQPVGAPASGRPRGCCSEVDAADVRRVADRLGVPFHVKELADGFADLKRYFAESYHAGRTPNPCIRCNRTLKFGALSELARGLGCAAVATGHYVRRDIGPDGDVRIRRGVDIDKDQSYVLLSLDRDIVRRTLFPLGDYTKAEVRAIAERFGLGVANKAESMDVCFVPDDYREFLERLEPGRIEPGRFVDVDGNDLGPHDGHQRFTIGQRKGLGRAFGRPTFVVAKEVATNRVVLGSRDELAVARIHVDEVGWISMEPIVVAGGEEQRFDAHVQVRHRHRAVPATVTVRSDASLTIDFETPEIGVAPGQGAAIYRDDVLLAGGWIADTVRVDRAVPPTLA